MAAFPQFGNVYDTVQKTIKSRAGNNIKTSELKPWIRVSSGFDDGLVLASNLKNDNFNNRYGDSKRSGRIGTNFVGDSVLERSFEFTRSLRPSPVIESINIKNGSEGLSRKLTFQIKCFTLPQLDTLTQYFLEPRFYLLMEWGWNTNLAYSQMAKVQGVDSSTAICDMISYMNLGVLKDKRANSHGHYDAFLGVITGGGVEYGDDETYIVSVEVTTQGEIPAYLQQHKGAVRNGLSITSSIIFDVEKEIAPAEKGGNFGKVLFMYMYNDLPASKQTENVKNLINDEYWTNEYHYLNMNKSLRDTLLEQVRDVSVNVVDENGETVKGRIPSDQPLMGKERFIRLELAWKILNTGDEILIPRQISCKKGSSSMGLDSEISIENTIIRAHKHIFSTSKEYLYIPNDTGPDFGLERVLTQTTDLVVEGGFLQLNVDDTLKTKKFGTNGLKSAGKLFPQTVSLDTKGAAEYDNTYIPLTCDAYEWGYLKDLFINFDFFIQCMDRNGYVIKDVALEILNGLSSGANLFWDFQIVNVGSSSSTKDNIGDECLEVVDRSFSGKPPTSRASTLSLQSIGVNSPFLEFSIKLEVAGAIANSVMAQRNSEQSPGGKSDTNVEAKAESFSGLFAPFPDGVTFILNTIRQEEDAGAAKLESERIAQSQLTELEAAKAELEKKIEAGTEDESDIYKVGNAQFRAGDYADAISSYGKGIKKFFGRNFESASDSVIELVTGENKEQRKNRASNYEFFMQKAGVYPKVNNPNADVAKEFFDFIKSNDTAISEDTIVCGIWGDSQLLRQIYEYDLNPSDEPELLHQSLKKNPGYLPVEVTFTIHGVSGLKVGDLIHFKDLPHIYRSKLFSIFEVEQTVNDDLWQTTATAKLRNITI